ncbi:DUF1349 domain-containing protein [Nostocaceae cyanobacterium CENA357]|uniref:DUF1349 domain-containing protein n=1 Tax=Atlanticothrix silvestris CENA357 TaxID=1725252 RepID=A0A8J7HM48_9CYAN|nr:DUF1349 domain-containing protein [Atlanticothrix silvestris]MBH8555694.1 DUF1349 domain-containing protein [Atlanticothrix silvestris CENA357]
MEWYNEPPVWEVIDEAIAITSGAKTDFWRETHYGFIRDNGHFFYQQVQGEFIVEVKVSGEYQELYDQAGLMVRLDEFNWLKCGIEFVNNVQQVSAVVTRDYSDWSVVPMPHNPPAIWMRVTRCDTAVEVQYSLDGTDYQMLRLAYLTPVKTVSVGIMCASPEGNGFPMRFEKFQIRSL